MNTKTTAGQSAANSDLVRASRDGDQFHYHWAARHCLSLLPGVSDLVAISIEGASAAEGAAAVLEGDELIDVGFYYGSEQLEDARLVRYVQLKHSTKQAHEPWTASGLDKTLAGNSKRFLKLREKFWAAAGLMDTLLRWKIEPEVVYGNKTAFQPGVQGRGGQAGDRTGSVDRAGRA